MTTGPVRYVSGGRSFIIWFYFSFLYFLFGWENRLISVLGAVVGTVFDLSDTFDTLNIVNGCWILSVCYTLPYRKLSIEDLSTRAFCNYGSVIRSFINTLNIRRKSTNISNRFFESNPNSDSAENFLIYGESNQLI